MTVHDTEARPVAAWTAAVRGPEPEVEPTVAPATLLDAVTDLRRDVEATALPLPLAGVERALEVRQRLIDQLDGHLLPRLFALSAPAIVVVAGSTGAGKSTLVNSLLREEVSAAGVIRPTTRQPVLAHNPADAGLLGDHPLLAMVDAVEHAAVPRGLALVDAPDLDSLLESNRKTAHRLLETADLWLFVTTAARYGDAVPWEMLDRAAERSTSMAMVLNRVPGEATVVVRADLAARLRARGLQSVPLFMIPDLGPHEGLLTPTSVAAISRWLMMVAGPDRARSVIARTQRGALVGLRPWVDELAEAVQRQVDARAKLQQALRSAVRVPAERAAAELSAGSLLNGPVGGAWERWSGASGPLAGSWTARRGRARRTEALSELAAELRAAVTVSLAAARHSGDRAVLDVLDGELSGAWGQLAAAGTSDAPGTAPTPEQSAADWLAAAAHAVRLQTDDADRGVARNARRLRDRLGEDGIGTLVALAAAGLQPARTGLVRAIGGDATDDVVGRVRTDLEERTAEQVSAAAAPALGALGTADLADDAAARLRLRLAVLKGLR